MERRQAGPSRFRREQWLVFSDHWRGAGLLARVTASELELQLDLLFGGRLFGGVGLFGGMGLLGVVAIWAE